MSQEIHYSGTHEELRRLLWGFIAALSGRSGEYAEYARGIKLRVGMVALACVQEAFLAKASGGTGDDGIAWAALKKETIAARPLGPGDKKLMKGYGAHNGYDSLGRANRGFLTPQEDDRWRKIYGTRKATFMGKFGMDDAASSALAAQIAWATLKSEGAKTKLDVLGNRHVEIGRSSGRLFNSLSPGIEDPDSFPILEVPPEVVDRVLREEIGAIIVGSNVEYAGPFHALRPLWPSGDLPPAWSARISEAARTGIAEAIVMIMANQTPTRRVA